MAGVAPLLSRRAALTSAGAAAAALAGCGDAADAGSASAAPSPDPDEQALRQALEGEEHLRTVLRVTVRVLPRLEARLDRVRDVHDDHVELLAHALDARTDETAAAVPQSPRTPLEALRFLAAAERSLAEGHAAAALGARSGPFARVLAAMAAAADQQAHVLDGLAAAVPGRG